ncbi:MAG: HD domain-containing phosphohydrolase, partial [Bauldia litoralis]
MSELLGALSHALDLTEGQADGHCIRCCWIGIHIGREIGLSDHEIWELYYTLLLKDLGCSSNAARICQLYLADDLTLKHDFKLVGGGLPQVLKFVVSHAGADGSLADRLRTVLDQMKNGDRYVHEVIETRCHRGADIARQMRFSEGVALGIQGLDEHWDGGGQPYGLKGEQIPVYARIALLAQVVDVFNSSGGPASARAEARRRAGKWFDPALDEAFTRVSATDAFWHRLAAPDLDRIVLDLEPAHQARPVDDDFLDEIAAAFAQVVDSKSPYTAGHSERVAL